MRDHAIVSPRFWTGPTGRFLRDSGPDAQRLALYLITCPNSNMIGLYYLPLPTLCHELGISLEGASKALQRVSEGQFAYYDNHTETVFVVEMARFQIGERLSARDNRVKAVKKLASQFRNSPFYQHFMERYGIPFSLEEAAEVQAPSKPLRSQDQDQDQDQDQEQDTKRGAAAAGASSRSSRPEDIPIPPTIDTPAVRQAIGDWFAQRRAKRLSLRHQHISRQYDRLAGLTPGQVVACLRNTIDNDYAGIFPEAFSNGNGHSHVTAATTSTSARIATKIGQPEASGDPFVVRIAGLLDAGEITEAEVYAAAQAARENGERPLAYFRHLLRKDGNGARAAVASATRIHAADLDDLEATE